MFYLDTSAVLPLALADAGTLPAKEQPRHSALTAFAAKARSAPARLVASVLAFEEIGAKTRNDVQRAVLARVDHRSWNDYQRADAVEALRDRKIIQGMVLQMLEHTARALGSLGVVVEQPVDADASTAGHKLRKAHREFLRLYENIDSMDALHIAFGAMLGCKHFITFDNGWAQVAEIEVLGL